MGSIPTISPFPSFICDAPPVPQSLGSIPKSITTIAEHPLASSSPTKEQLEKAHHRRNSTAKDLRSNNFYKMPQAGSDNFTKWCEKHRNALTGSDWRLGNVQVMDLIETDLTNPRAVPLSEDFEDFIVGFA